jgi:hypothetical protein
MERQVQHRGRCIVSGLKWLVSVLAFALSAYTQENPPRVLQIYRDFLKPGSDNTYRRIEEKAARICMKLKCPHPYLAIESLTGSKEAWFFNGYDSPAEQKQVAEDYQKNPVLMKALSQIANRKTGLISEPANVFANHRPELSRGTPWRLGRGRFLVITVTNSNRKVEGTVFETNEGTQFIIRSAQTRHQADEWAGAAGSETRVFAVCPKWSMPAKDWTVDDPAFWTIRCTAAAAK